MRSRGIELLNLDCLDLLKSLPDASVNLMLTDPPYGITQNDWDKPINLAEMWLKWERVVKPNGAFVFTTSQPFTSELIMSRRGFFKYELIWKKSHATDFLNCKIRPMRAHENVIVFYRQQCTYNPQIFDKPKKNIRPITTKPRLSNNYGDFKEGNTRTIPQDKSYPDSILIFDNESKTETWHQTQKPVDLFRYLIKTYSNPGETVFDGYSGSGTTAEACIIEGRKFIGSELNKEYYDKSIERLSIVLSKPQLVFP
ncbi:MAG: site-specific DNA-methyltransferase [Cyclobacteriaceae bacterium]|nr:site-specific DNA-methyltransferase [Cyclobacteriaceae bacterium]